jgi:hypothetical protein
MTTERRDFEFKSWDLLDAIDALMGYDQGARDSGGFDLELRQAVVTYLKEIDDDARRKVLARFARRFLTDEHIVAGYGLADVWKFMDWLFYYNICIT